MMMKLWGMRWMWLVVYMGEKRDTCRVSVRKFEGKEPLGRPRRKWEDVKGDVK
jgi:hypothetical protein